MRPRNELQTEFFYSPFTSFAKRQTLLLIITPANPERCRFLPEPGFGPIADIPERENVLGIKGQHLPVSADGHPILGIALIRQHR